MFELPAREAFAGWPHPDAAPGAGVVVEPLDGRAIVSVQARAGAEPELRSRLRAGFGVAAPDGPTHIAADGVGMVGTGPGAWLILSQGRAGFARALAEQLSGVAAVADQSGAYGLLTLSGPRVVDLLAKGVFLDLHPSVFPRGAAASTNLAHIPVVLWRMAQDSFELLVPRSYAADLAHWLEESAAEFGLGGAAP